MNEGMHGLLDHRAGLMDRKLLVCIDNLLGARLVGWFASGGCMDRLVDTFIVNR